MPYSRKKLDLTGQRFGRLTVLRPAVNIGRRTAWVCQCDCGEEMTARTADLRRGHVHSCGCMENGLASLTYIDGTCVEMIQSRTVRRNNTSGVPGVDWLTAKRRWRATICFQGKRRYLGSFPRFEDAVRARKQAEELLYDSFLEEFARASENRPAKG